MTSGDLSSSQYPSFDVVRRENDVCVTILLSFLGRKLSLVNYFEPFNHFDLFGPLEAKLNGYLEVKSYERKKWAIVCFFPRGSSRFSLQASIWKNKYIKIKHNQEI